MDTEFDTLTITRPQPEVLLVTLDRPGSANALDTRMGEELRALWRSLYVEPGDTRCAVITGAGERAFCAGGDLKERDGMSDADWQRQHAMFEQMIRAMVECPVPIVAAVNGAAYGGGCEIALGADFVFAARRARFALTEVTLGIMPGAMGTQNLPRAVGLRRAKEIVLTGSPFDAGQAYEWGLVNRVCENESLLDETLAVAGRIAANAPIAVRQAKKSLDASIRMDPLSGYQFEIEAYNRMVSTEDRLEGVRAFNEGRKPRFRGR